MADYNATATLGSASNPDTHFLESLATPYGPSAAGQLATDIAALVVLVAAVTGANKTAVATDVATLVADGATPTQAHVTTLNTDWGVLNTAIGALTTAAVAADSAKLTTMLGKDAVLGWNTTTVQTLTQLRRLCDRLLQAAQSTGMKP